MITRIHPLLLLVSLALPAAVFQPGRLLLNDEDEKATQEKRESANHVPSVSPTFSPEQVKQDLKYLYETLEAAHYDLYARTSKVAFEKEYERIDGSIRGPLTMHEINRMFQRFAALGNIGHCYIGYYFGEYARDGNMLFPFDIIVREGDVLVRRNYSSDSRFEPGDQLLSVDGEPIDAALREVRRYISGERNYLKDSSMEGISFPRLLWFAHGNRGSYRVRVKKQSGTTLSARVNAVKARTFDELRGVNIPCRNDRAFKVLDGKTAYLYPGPFYNVSGGQMYDATTFRGFLESSFAEMAKSMVENLIIDLRDNPGGDNSFSDPMIAYFANRPFRFCSKYFMKTSRVLKDFWVNEVPKSHVKPSADTERMRQAILSHKDGEKFEYRINHHEPQRDSSRFRGKVYVLINRHSYSNATCAAALIKDYGFGELIGEETSDIPTSYASAASFSLPNTKINVTYPKGYFVRPNGDEKLKGVMPDHFATDDPFTPEDEVLEYTLRRIRSLQWAAPGAKEGP